MADVFMVSRLGTEALAAVGFSASLYSFVMIFCIGLSSGVGVTASSSIGKKGALHLGRILKNGLSVSLVFGLIIFVLLMLGVWQIELFRQPEVVNLLARPYLAILAMSIIPFVIMQNFKQVSEAMGNSRTPMFIILGGGLLNVLLNYLLIFGHFGFPQMGVTGAAVATLIARVCMVIACYVVLNFFEEYKPLRISLQEDTKIREDFKRPILKIGVPGGLQYTFEISLFACASIFMGWFGVVEQAAHQISINFAALSFMIPLGLASAAGLRVGYFKGRGDLPRVRNVGKTSLISLTLIMSILGIAFLGFNEVLPRVFSSDINVISISAQLLLVVAGFQIFDGLQTLGVSMLRGYGDTKVPTIMLLICYGFSIWFSYYLGFHTELRHVGIWLGLLVGLALTSLVLNLRFFWVTRSK